MDTTKGKSLWMECIKILSAFLVVMQHSISLEWRSTVGNGSFLANILNLIFMITRVSIPLFFMCSGAGMLAKDRTVKYIYKKNILGILIPYVCWMTIYSLYDTYRLFSQNLATPRVIINIFIKNIIFGQYHTWFIVTLVGLYAITPFLYTIARNAIHLRYFLVLSFIFTILLPYVERIEALDRLLPVIANINMRFVVGYSLYYLLGYYLTKIEITSVIKIASFVAFPTITFIGWIISCSYAKDMGQDCQMVYGDSTIIGFIISVSLFLIFRILFEKKTLSSKLEQKIIYISQLGIGIYLLHPIFMTPVQRLHGYYVIFGGLLLWSCVLIIMIIVSKFPIINTLFLRIKSQNKYTGRE